MDLYKKAFTILKSDKFDRRRYLAASKLYQMASGQEKIEIGELFEGQLSLIKDQEDLDWIAKVDSMFDSKD